MTKRRFTQLLLGGGLGAILAFGPAMPASAHARTTSWNGCTAYSDHQSSGVKAVWITSHNCTQTRTRVTISIDGTNYSTSSAWTSGNAYVSTSAGTYVSGSVAMANGGTQSNWVSH